MQFKIKENKVESWKLREVPGGVKGPELNGPGAQRPSGLVSWPFHLRLAVHRIHLVLDQGG